MSVNKFLECKGQFLKVRFTSEKKPAAKFKGTKLVKIVKGMFRAGVDFAKLKSTEEGISLGTRGPVQGLSYGQWLQFPYVIEHEGQLYYRLYTFPSSWMVIEYTVDGENVHKTTFQSFLTPSAAKEMDEKKIPPCINVKVENCEFPE